MAGAPEFAANPAPVPIRNLRILQRSDPHQAQTRRREAPASMAAGRSRISHDAGTRRRPEGRTGGVPRIRAHRDRAARRPLGSRGADPGRADRPDGACGIPRRPGPGRIRRVRHGHDHVRPPQRGVRAGLLLGAEPADGPRDGRSSPSCAGAARRLEEAMAAAAGHRRGDRGLRPDRARAPAATPPASRPRRARRGLLRPERDQGVDHVRADRRRRAHLRPAGRPDAARSWSSAGRRASRPRRSTACWEPGQR